MHRVLDHYLHTARQAAILLDPHFDALALPAPQPGTTVSEPATAEEAMAWFTAEHPGCWPPSGQPARPAMAGTPGSWRGR